MKLLSTVLNAISLFATIVIKKYIINPKELRIREQKFNKRVILNKKISKKIAKVVTKIK